jgi:Leucine-rich repeat (LRR) protein
MKDLYHLTFFFNKVRDITPLSGLTNLKTLKLGVNPISDFRPIKDIYDQLEEKDFTMK